MLLIASLRISALSQPPTNFISKSVVIHLPPALPRPPFGSYPSSLPPTTPCPRLPHSGFFLVPEFPQYGCEHGGGQTYSDCAPSCGHCSDLSGGQFMCDDCIQGCKCSYGQLWETSGADPVCVPKTSCSCSIPGNSMIYPAGSQGQIGCHQW